MENTFREAEITLFINDTDHSELKQGWPAFFLETEHDLKLFEEPTRFLRENYVKCGSTASSHTWGKAAYCLKSWFQYLQAIERDWLDASEQDRLDFRDVYLAAISPKTGRTYGASGVSNVMSTVRAFYAHCARRGTYFGDMGGSCITTSYSIPIDQDASAHPRSSNAVRIRDRALPKTRPGVKIHPLTVRDLRGFLHHIGPQAGSRNDDQRLVRDRLICDLGWAVGLRLNEINSLTTLQFMTLVPDPSAPFVGMSLTIEHGKGNKIREVVIPAWLVSDVQAYMNGERAAAIQACRTKTKYPTTRLIVGHEYSGRAGLPITNAALQKMFRAACLAIGLVTIVEKTDPETGEVFMYKTPRHSIHDLRHTYAVLTYHAERANGNAEPWKKIQSQLGHKNLQTTINTYLGHVEIFTDQTGLIDVRRMLGL